uniref:Uncharacterized protein n=1 Tax=Pavo cristatus TaxID=9049 RepID=A0A8C9FHK4_PAVCR
MDKFSNVCQTWNICLCHLLSHKCCHWHCLSLLQYATWRNDENLGGIEGCLSKLKAADPNFGKYDL